MTCVASFRTMDELTFEYNQQRSDDDWTNFNLDEEMPTRTRHRPPTSGFRSLAQLQSDFRQKNKSVSSNVSRASRKYDKNALLQVFASLRKTKAVSTPDTLGYAVVPARQLQCVEDPRLDDERRIAQLEARESRESGADTKNVDTFGLTSACEGWTYQEAVAANNKLKSTELFTPTWDAEWFQETATSGGEASENASESGAGEWEDSWAMPAPTEFGYVDYGCWYFDSQILPDYLTSEQLIAESWNAPPGLYMDSIPEAAYQVPSFGECSFYVDPV